MPEYLDPGQQAPLGRAKMLHNSVPDTDLHSHIPALAASLKARGHQSFDPGSSAKEGVKGRFAKELRAGHQCPAFVQARLVTDARAKEKLVSIGSPRHGFIY